MRPRRPRSGSGPDGHWGDCPATAAIVAPRGSFPSYTFSVDSSVGFKAGLPVQSLPIALGVLASDHAEASVSLGDAYTYGIDETALTKQLREWAITNPHSPGRWRINGVVVNMPEFEKAFSCKPGQPMVSEKRCKIW